MLSLHVDGTKTSDLEMKVTYFTSLYFAWKLSPTHFLFHEWTVEKEKKYAGELAKLILYNIKHVEWGRATQRYKKVNLPINNWWINEYKESVEIWRENKAGWIGDNTKLLQIQLSLAPMLLTLNLLRSTRAITCKISMLHRDFDTCESL